MTTYQEDDVRSAAENGNASAQCKLGAMYNKGQGVVRDKAEAVKWYRLAANQGNAAAQDTLGYMYQYGWGVAKTMPRQ